MKAIIFIQVKEEGSIYGKNIQPITYLISNMDYIEYKELREYLITKECEQLDQQFMPNQVDINDIQLKFDDHNIWYEIDFEKINKYNMIGNLKSMFIDAFKKVGICGKFKDSKMPTDMIHNQWKLILSIEIDEQHIKIEY